MSQDEKASHGGESSTTRRGSRPGGHDLTSLTISLDDIPRTPRRLVGSISPHRLIGLAGGAQVDDPGEVELTALAEGKRLRVEGRVQGRVTLACSRCLASFSLDVRVDVDRLFSTEPDQAGSGARETPEEEISHLSDAEFRLSELVDEELVLALPMVPLCREECLGLCSQCGVDLNAGFCNCPPPTVDNPFAVLRGLVDK